MDQGMLAELEAYPERVTTVQWMQLLSGYRELERLADENEELRVLLQHESDRAESLARDLELAEEEIENLKEQIEDLEEQIEDLEEYGND